MDKLILQFRYFILSLDLKKTKKTSCSTSI